MRVVVKGMLVVLVAAFMAVAMTAQEKHGGNPEAAKVKNPVAMSPESIAAGEALYMKRCRGCHGRDAAGGPPKEAGDHPASNLIDDQWDHGGTDGEIFYIIDNGVRFTGMPAFGTGESTPAGDKQLWELVQFVRRLPRLTDDELALLIKWLRSEPLE